MSSPENILIVGSGAREHAIGWKINKDSPDTNLTFAPGNGGTSEIGTNVDIDPTDISRLTDFAKDSWTDLVIVGPEWPLVGGLTNSLSEAEVESFGPTQEAAFLEGDKAKAVEFMERFGIPHPDSEIFEDFAAAENFLKGFDRADDLVIKASGLAEGKGVFLPDSEEEALKIVRSLMLNGALGEAGRKVVIQERLVGDEVSVIGFVSNEIGLLVPARDYKRAHDGDEGPNTGGMGAYAPNEKLDLETLAEIYGSILLPTQEGMIENGTPFNGALYVGIMLTDSGPKVLEYNVRFGDPETQVQMRLLKSNLLKNMRSSVRGSLDPEDVRVSDEAAVGVVLAADGYPGKFELGKRIQGLDTMTREVVVFHGGTKKSESGLVTNGGRVLTVTSVAPTLEEARLDIELSIADSEYGEGIWVEDSFHRNDIAG